jgi:hypothetical protein
LTGAKGNSPVNVMEHMRSDAYHEKIKYLSGSYGPQYPGLVSLDLSVSLAYVTCCKSQAGGTEAACARTLHHGPVPVHRGAVHEASLAGRSAFGVSGLSHVPGAFPLGLHSETACPTAAVQRGSKQDPRTGRPPALISLRVAPALRIERQRVASVRQPDEVIRDQ